MLNDNEASEDCCLRVLNDKTEYTVGCPKLSSTRVPWLAALADCYFISM